MEGMHIKLNRTTGEEEYIRNALRRRRWLWAAAREVGAGSGRRRDVDGGGARLARWGEQDGPR